LVLELPRFHCKPRVSKALKGTGGSGAQVFFTTSPRTMVPVAAQVVTAVLFLRIVRVIMSPLVSPAPFLVVSAYIAIFVRLQAIGIGAPRAGSSFDAVEL